MSRVFVFGEAERGEYCTPVKINRLEDLLERLGYPPVGSLGIDYAVQTLLCKWDLVFYRVREEGFSLSDYQKGAQLLNRYGNQMQISAICMPGVGDQELIGTISPLCQAMHAILLVSERDFYDYLTGSKY